MEEAVKQLLNIGLAGICILALVYERKTLVADRKAVEAKLDTERKEWQARLDSTLKHYQQELENLHARIEAKWENNTRHLLDLSLQDQANEAKTASILAELLAAVRRRKGVPTE